MISPCTKVCQIDQRTKLCLGCYRSLDEIASWATMRADERQKVMDDLDRRRPEREAS